MKKLVRSNEPGCLSKYKSGKDRWDKVTYQHKQEIWASLHLMQGEYCAYCESKLTESGKQIEHFRSRERFNQLTFSWDNLFGACNNPNRCGNHKDNKKRNTNYNPDELIKPDQDTLINYAIILDDGIIKCNNNVSNKDLIRAEATIRAFNLNGDTSLINLRRSYITAVKCYAENLISHYSEEYGSVNHELKLFIASHPYQTILYKFLGFPLS